MMIRLRKALAHERTHAKMVEQETSILISLSCSLNTQYLYTHTHTSPFTEELLTGIVIIVTRSLTCVK